MENKQTVVEWLVEQFTYRTSGGVYTTDGTDDVTEVVNQAKEMENSRSQEYAEFAIRCDRMGMKILNFEDWIKL